MVSTSQTDTIKKLVRRVRADDPSADPQFILSLVASIIIKSYVGIEWMETHVMGLTSPTNFFRNNKPYDLYEYDLRSTRLVALAEMLINLSRVRGFKKVLSQLITGNIESTFAELEVGSILSKNMIDFDFVESTGVKGADYDIAIHWCGHVISADTKCKIENTSESVQTILRSLKSAREQLDTNIPGAVFIKAPQSWHNIRTLEDDPIGNMPDFTALEEAVRIFYAGMGNYSGTSQIVMVACYFTLAVKNGDLMQSMMLVKQISNFKHRFGAQLNLDILKPILTTPSHWLDLVKICVYDQTRRE